MNKLPISFSLQTRLILGRMLTGTVDNFFVMPVMLVLLTLGLTKARAVDFHVATAQDLQNALTVAAANGANNNIWLTNGYFIGTFNYNSTASYNLAIMAETNLNNLDVTVDGGGGGRAFNLTCSGSSGNITVSNITFVRNSGNYSTSALQISAASGGNINVGACRFLSTPTSQGVGLDIVAGQNTTIQNCTIIGKTNGINDGDGIDISGVTGNTLIYGSTISWNYNGYGLYLRSGAVLSFSNNIIQNNSQGGLFFDPSGSQTAQVLIIANVFNGNNNGGLSLYNFNNLNLSGNTFVSNSGGGALYLSSGISASVVGNNFSSNSGPYYGATFFDYIGLVVLGGNVFVGNSAYSGENGYGGAGGAVLLASTPNENAVISNNTFNANASTSCGGAISLGGSAASAVQAISGTTTIVGNTFTGNSSGGVSGEYEGGGALFINGGTNLIFGNLFNQNSSVNGGGAVSANGPNIIFSDNLLIKNTQSAASATGGGIFVSPSSTLYLINNTIFGNTSGGGGGGAAFQTSGTQSLYVFNNIIWGNSAVGSGADVYFAGGGTQTELLYNDLNNVYGVWDIAQNPLNVDPQFFDPVNGDYHFPGASPCANAGTNGAPSLPLTDLDGNARTNSLGQVDLGCYEFNTTATHPSDTNAVFAISGGEYSAYAAAWKSGQIWTNAPGSAPNPGPIPANYVTRAGYLMTNGGVYHNDGSARPTNWKLIGQ